MNLYEQWEDIANVERSAEEHNKFWQEYFEEEKSVYAKVLGDKKNPVEGKISELASKYGVSEVTFIGFIDGINTSLKKEVDVEKLESDSEVSIDIDYEKLYFNMHDAKAEWLYELTEWEDILTEEKRKEIAKEYRESKIVRVTKIGRNEPCPCGSGKKYKKCCGK